MGELTSDQKTSSYQWVNIEDIEKLPGRQGIYLCQTLALLWKGMPNNRVDEIRKKIGEVSLPDFLYKVRDSQEVIFYGGSFNPWHEGHESCVKQAPSENIIIVPDYNPWKAKRNSFFGPTCRWASLRELALKFKDRGFSFYPGFWGIETPNPTSRWMPEVEYSQKSLIIGDDNFMSFDKWKNTKYLIGELERIYVIPRLHALTDIERKKREFESLFSTDVFQVMEPHEYQHVSSTAIRSAIKREFAFPL